MHQFIVPQRVSPAASSHCGGPAPERKGAASAPCAPAMPAVPAEVTCRIVRQIVQETTAMTGERPLWRRDRRRAACHVRQVAMYVCHVVLRLSLSQIGAAFGRDRTTVSHACNVVEDRRDDAAFDAFVSAIERLVLSVFGPAGIGSHA